MPKRILLTGATGTLGAQLLPRLLAAGFEVRALSRRPHRSSENSSLEWVVGDLRDGAGVEAAVADVNVILHAASAQRGDLYSARHLLDAARHGGCGHLIYISIVGVDRIPLGYYKTKLAVEGLIADSCVPSSILRATQFHDLVLAMFRVQRHLPLLFVPAGMSLQPVDAGEVADRLTGIATADPVGRVADLGGPQIRDAGELARAYLRASGRHQFVVPLFIPGKVGRAYRRGDQLSPDHPDGRISFEQFLAARSEAAAPPGSIARDGRSVE